MNNSFNDIEELLIGYFSGDLSEEDRLRVEKWRQETPGNEKLYNEMLFGWNAMPLLQEMEQFNSFEALKKVNPKLANMAGIRWITILQRVAAVLIIPLIAYAAYLIVNNNSLKQLVNTEPVIQMITSKQGTVSQLSLSDGTKVWLNSGSTLQFPLSFTGRNRKVKLTGEAYFEIAKNENQPFILNANELNVEVLGTSFNAVSYDNETVSEVVLVTGKVKLFANAGNRVKQCGSMHPGQRMIFTRKTQDVTYEQVDVEKYIAWRKGELLFRNDPMNEVVKRLSRWYNVEIYVKDREINEYIYNATFSDETLSQVLNMLKISAPIDYRIIASKPSPNGGFTKQKVILMKKKY